LQVQKIVYGTTETTISQEEVNFLASSHDTWRHIQSRIQTETWTQHGEDVKRLTTKDVLKLGPEMHADGNCLYPRVLEADDGTRALDP
jgi:hypothetical protein